MYNTFLLFSMLDLSSSLSNNIEWGNILCRARISHMLCIYISPYYKATRHAYHIYHTNITWYNVVVIKQGGSQVWQISCQEPHPVSRVGPCQISRINISVIIVINTIIILITTPMILSPYVFAWIVPNILHKHETSSQYPSYDWDPYWL